MWPFLARLKERKLAHWCVAHLAAVWLLLKGPAMTASRIVLVLGLLVVLPVSLPAQERPPAELEQLEQGKRVRIHTHNSAPIEIEGRFQRISPDLLALELSEGRAVPIREIADLRVRGTRARTGLIIGGVLGGGAGGLFGMYLCGMDETSDCSLAGTTALGAIAGGALVGGLGALIGAAVPRWRLVYERPRDP